ncbi:MAG: hypothetical protein JJE50_05010 [Actinomycetales bacterium]|nr:hypothetical protein [Actinomycetales bacterium]
MRLRPGFEVYWRDRGASQIGVDPRCAVRLEGLSDAEQRLLDRLPTALDGDELLVRGQELGIPEQDVTGLLERLVSARVLVAELPPGDPDPDDVYWHLAAAAGQPRPAPRSAAMVEIRGVDQLGLRIACVLSQAGVGTVLLRDERLVLAEDLGAGVFRESDVGAVRERVGLAVLRSVCPLVGVSAPSGARPDLVVVVDHGVVDPVPLRILMREDVAHLPVLVRELDVVVGPLVRPGLGVCLRCVDLHRCDQDPRWPAVATQIAARPPRGVETSLAWLGAALAAHQALAMLDGRPVAVDGASLEVSASDPLPARREWAVHPECGCAPTTFDVAPDAQATSRR